MYFMGRIIVVTVLSQVPMACVTFLPLLLKLAVLDFVPSLDITLTTVLTIVRQLKLRC